MALSERQARVHLCGPVRIELEGEQVEQALPGRQGRLLFAYLLLERDRWVSREELAALLWPRRPPASAGSTLRALLSKLRAALGGEAVCGTSELRIDLGEGAWIDVEAAVSAVKRAHRAVADRGWREAWSAAQVALSVASRRFLPGDEREWVEDKRRELEEVRVAALERLAQAAFELGGSELVAAERCARAILEAAPYRESGYLLLMRTLAARGNPAEAVRVYDEARTRLRDELGIPPAAELRALNERLLAACADVPQTLSTPPPGASSGLPPLLAGVERTPLIGRAHELERLIARVEAARASGPVAVTLTGEAGIGKTRLISELAHVVHDRNTVVLYGTAPREPSPYQPFLDALHDFIRQAPSDSLARLRVIDPPVLARLLPELHEAALSPAAQRPAEEHAGRPRAFAGLTRMIEEIAGRARVILALDDMHWADPATVQLLAHLLRTIRPASLLALVAYRPQEAPPMLAQAIDQARRRAPIDNIDLPPLTEQDVEALISAWAGTGAPANFARDLHERSDGNPLFIGHLLRHLVRAGAIDPDLRRWSSGPDIRAVGVPHEVRELIELRLASLDDRARQALSIAAVVGPEFTLRVVERAIPDTGEHVLDALDAGLRAGLIMETGAPTGGFRFAHALVREAIYGQLSSARRGRLHRAVGEAIEVVHAADLSPHRAELARHFLVAARAGEDPTPAIHSSIAAAEQARSLFANEQAEAHYNAALEFLQHRGDSKLRLQACEGLGDMLTIRTEYPEAIDAYLEGLAEAPTDWQVVRARLERKIGRAHMRAHAPAAAGEAFDRAERELQPARGPQAAVAEMIEIGLDRLTLLYWDNEIDAMGRLIGRLRGVVEAQGSAAQQVRLLHSVLVREIRRQRYRLTHSAVELARDALTAAEATADPALLGAARFQLGFSLLLADDADDALDHLKQAVDFGVRTGDLMLQARALTYVSVVHRRRLRPEEAERSAREALDAATAATTPEYQAIARSNLAWVAVRAGDLDAAREHAQFARTRFSNISSLPNFWMPLALWPLIAVTLIKDDLVSATAYAEQLLALPGRPVSRPAARLLKAGIDFQIQDPPGSVQHLLRALELGDGITLTTPALAVTRR